MNFKDLENVEHGTVLVDENGIELYFCGFNPSKDRVFTEYAVWRDYEIANWTIKRKTKSVKLKTYLNLDNTLVHSVKQLSGDKLVTSIKYNDDGTVLDACY